MGRGEGYYHGARPTGEVGVRALYLTRYWGLVLHLHVGLGRGVAPAVGGELRGGAGSGESELIGGIPGLDHGFAEGFRENAG